LETSSKVLTGDTHRLWQFLHSVTVLGIITSLGFFSPSRGTSQATSSQKAESPDGHPDLSTFCHLPSSPPRSPTLFLHLLYILIYCFHRVLLRKGVILSTPTSASRKDRGDNPRACTCSHATRETHNSNLPSTTTTSSILPVFGIITSYKLNLVEQRSCHWI
jgi:hypothetical protein